MMSRPALDLPALTGVFAGSALLILGRHQGWLAAYFPAVLLLTYACRRLSESKDATRYLLAIPALATCFVLTPDLSDDHHRYLWEGYVQTQGYSPYIHAPNTLYDTLEHPSEGLVNHDDLTAIYPPLAQYFFRLSTLLGHSVYAWKWVLLFSFAALMCLPEARATSWWWLAAPAVLVEGIWNGHLDALCLVPAWLLVQGLEKNRGVQSGLALGALIALKLMPVLLGPLCLLGLRGRQRLHFLLIGPALVLLLYLPFLDHPADLFASFGAFANNWSFNNPLFSLAALVLDPALVRKLMAVALLVGCLLILRPQWDIRRRLTATWLLLIALSPTVYPWYLVWLIAFAPTDRGFWANWIYAACFFSYLVLIPYRAGEPWREAWWWMLPEWIAMTYGAYRLLRKQGPNGS